MKRTLLTTLWLAVAPLAGQGDNEGFVIYGVGGDDIGVGFVDIPGSYTWAVNSASCADDSTKKMPSCTMKHTSDSASSTGCP